MGRNCFKITFNWSFINCLSEILYFLRIYECWLSTFAILPTSTTKVILFELQDISLYAETVDGIVGVARSVDGVKYQVRQLTFKVIIMLKMICNGALGCIDIKVNMLTKSEKLLQVFLYLIFWRVTVGNINKCVHDRWAGLRMWPQQCLVSDPSTCMMSKDMLLSGRYVCKATIP